MVDAGADNNVDLIGGYYDAGDNVKFNFPQAFTLTMLAWSRITFAEGYTKSGQMEYLLDAIKWGTDYLIKCHTSKNELYVQVGNGQLDHTNWVAPEYITYEYPSYKITEGAPGSEVAGETAAALAAASILFQKVDSSYSSTLLKHSQEIYDFADKNRGDYTKTVPAKDFYESFSGYNDELAWGLHGYIGLLEKNHIMKNLKKLQMQNINLGILKNSQDVQDLFLGMIKDQDVMF